MLCAPTQKQILSNINRKNSANDCFVDKWSPKSRAPVLFVAVAQSHALAVVEVFRFLDLFLFLFLEIPLVAVLEDGEEQPDVARGDVFQVGTVDGDRLIYTIYIIDLANNNICYERQTEKCRMLWR